jgi:hypothetical protein
LIAPPRRRAANAMARLGSQYVEQARAWGSERLPTASRSVGRAPPTRSPTPSSAVDFGRSNVEAVPRTLALRKAAGQSCEATRRPDSAIAAARAPPLTAAGVRMDRRSRRVWSSLCPWRDRDPSQGIHVSFPGLIERITDRPAATASRPSRCPAREVGRRSCRPGRSRATSRHWRPFSKRGCGHPPARS